MSVLSVSLLSEMSVLSQTKLTQVEESYKVLLVCNDSSPEQIFRILLCTVLFILKTVDRAGSILMLGRDTETDRAGLRILFVALNPYSLALWIIAAIIW